MLRLKAMTSKNQSNTIDYLFSISIPINH